MIGWVPRVDPQLQLKSGGKTFGVCAGNGLPKPVMHFLSFFLNFFFFFLLQDRMGRRGCPKPCNIFHNRPVSVWDVLQQCGSTQRWWNSVDENSVAETTDERRAAGPQLHGTNENPFRCNRTGLICSFVLAWQPAFVNRVCHLVDERKRVASSL